MNKNYFIFIVFTIIGMNLVFAQFQQNSLPVKSGEPSTPIFVLSNKGFSPQSAFLLMELDNYKKENKT